MAPGERIYLDFNATTPLLEEVVDAMLPYLRDHYGNPSSQHGYGTVARRAVEHARGQVSELLGCDADELIFTSGGTEANNLAIRGSLEAAAHERHVVTTCIEHAAVAHPCNWLEQRGYLVTRLSVDKNGIASIGEARRVLHQPVPLVSVMHSNNETGVLQPVSEIAELARAAGALCHSDAAQSVGKVRVNVRELKVDLLSVAGHKLYAPKGVGALYVRRGTAIAPVLLGAGHERGLRPGTENVASIVGFGVACERANKDLERVRQHLQAMRELLWESLASSVPGIELTGHATLRLPNTLNVRFPSVSGTAVLNGAPEVLASTGAACHDGREKGSSVLLAMGIPAQDAVGAVRFSVGRQTTVSDVMAAAAQIAAAWRRAVSTSVPPAPRLSSRPL